MMGAFIKMTLILLKVQNNMLLIIVGDKWLVKGDSDLI